MKWRFHGPNGIFIFYLLHEKCVQTAQVNYLKEKIINFLFSFLKTYAVRYYSWFYGSPWCENKHTLIRDFMLVARLIQITSLQLLQMEDLHV
jgi:hypothetical protein